MYFHDLFSKRPMIANAIATQPTPASAPAATPHDRFVVGPARNIARFKDIISAKRNDQPNMRALLKVCTSASVKLLTRIQALPKSNGEYQRPPSMNVETAAASTASKLIVEKSIVISPSE